MKPLDISPQDLETVQRILRPYVSETVVRAFGSRVSSTVSDDLTPLGSRDGHLAIGAC